jgi:hypothetical protein
MKTFLQIILLILFLSSIQSQTVYQQWAARYVNPYNHDASVSFASLDSSGNIFLGGYIDKGNFSTSYLTIKYNSSGVQQWASIYDSPAAGYGRVCKAGIDVQSNIIVTGTSPGLGPGDLCTIKYNTNGTQQWLVRYNFNPAVQLIPTDLKIDNNGNIYILGYNGQSDTSHYNPAFLIKYNSSGVQQWIKHYNISNCMIQSSEMLLDNQGYIYASLGVMLFEAGDNVLVKFNQNGDTVWSRTYAHSMNNSTATIKFLAFDNNGNIVMAGSGSNYLYYQSYYYYMLHKFTPSGTNLWSANNQLGTTYGILNAFAVDKNGNSYLAGSNSSSGKILKYSSDGVQQWVYSYSVPPAYFEPSAVAVDSSKNIYVTGSTSVQNDTNGTDAVTFKLNTFGEKQWEIKYRYLNYDEIPKVTAINKFNDIIISGTSGKAFQIPMNIFTVKYSQPVGITPVSQIIPQQYFLFQNYPNPFNPSTKIKFSLPLPSKGGVHDVRLVIYDLLGKEITVLVPPLWGGQEGLSPGTYEVEWNASDYPSGIYFYKLKTDSFNQTKRMVLVK